MKLRLFSFCCAVSLLALASCSDKLTGPSNMTSSSDTIAYWTFDGNTKDVTGNGHDGIAFGTPDYYAGNRFGGASAGTAIDLNNMSWVSVPDKADLDFTAKDSYTISAWVNLSGTVGSNYLAGGVSNIVDKMPSPLIKNQKIQTGYGMYADSGRFSAQILDGDLITLQTNNPVRFGTWHLVTLVVAAHESATLFLDSSAVDSRADTLIQTIVSSNVPILMGAVPGNSQSDSTSLDDILIVHHAMSGSEVATRFHEGGWYEHTDTVVTPPSGTWNMVNSNISDALITGQFVNSAIGFASGANGTFLATTDSGSTWSQRSSAPTTGTIYGISFLNGATTGFAAGDTRDISKTTDGGITWQAMDASNIVQTEFVRSIYFTNQSTGYVGTADGSGAASGSIYQSIDGGQTWNSVFSTNGGIYNIDFIPASNGRNGVAMGRFGVNYWTTDGGASWHPGSTDQANSLISRSSWVNSSTGFAVASDLNNSNGYILKTTDAGHTWKTVQTVSNGLHGIATNGAGTTTAVGNNGIVLESTDGGTTWSQSFASSNLWYDIHYVTAHRAVLFGANGDIDVRDK